MENRYLLISDVDGTLLGDDDALAQFSQWYEPRSHQLRLVYNSGRFVNSVMESVASTGLPEPAAIIGGVGTEIRCFASQDRIGDWPDSAGHWNPQRIRSVLSKYSELELQPEEFLSEYKISYFARNAKAELLTDIRQQLEAAECRVEVVYSSNRDLDVLPQGVNKGTAAAYLASRWSYRNDQVFVSGDTGNDIALFQHGFRGIVVGNAQAELKKIDIPGVFLAKKGYAGGVQEGLTHWLAKAKGVSKRETRSADITG